MIRIQTVRMKRSQTNLKMLFVLYLSSLPIPTSCIFNQGAYFFSFCDKNLNFLSNVVKNILKWKMLKLSKTDENLFQVPEVRSSSGSQKFYALFGDTIHRQRRLFRTLHLWRRWSKSLVSGKRESKNNWALIWLECII